MNKIPIGFPFTATPFRSNGERSEAGYQQQGVVLMWQKQMGKKKTMIIDTYMGKMKITKELVDSFLSKLNQEDK